MSAYLLLGVSGGCVAYIYLSQWVIVGKLDYFGEGFLDYSGENPFSFFDTVMNSLGSRRHECATTIKG
jgi:hypothetical protein